VNTQDILRVGTGHLSGLSGHVFDLLTVSKPISPSAAINLSKVVSKLSPLLGNLIEFNTVEYLNDQEDFFGLGEWHRQDPGFPDTVFLGDVYPTPGFEIKAWFPLATEITARFKDSQNHFQHDETHVCMLAWLPEYLIYGKPKIIDVCVVSGQSVAKARDDHYHNPPDYLVLEPEDTTARTSNLQQTNRPKGPEAAYLGFWKNKWGTDHVLELCRYIATFSAGILNPRPSCSVPGSALQPTGHSIIRYDRGNGFSAT